MASPGSAQVRKPPALTAVAVTPVTGIGVRDRSPVTAGPSWPALLRPQHWSVLSGKRAQVWKPPPEIATAPEIPATVTGVEALVTVPSPSWPDSFAPQQRTAPS